MLNEVAIFIIVGVGKDKNTGETRAVAYTPEEREKALKLIGKVPGRENYFQLVVGEKGNKTLFFPVVDEKGNPLVVYAFNPKEEVLREGILGSLKERDGAYYLPVIHTEKLGKGLNPRNLFESVIPIYPEEVEAIELFLKAKKEWEKTTQYGLPYDEGALNIPIAGFFLMPGEGLVFYSFVSGGELQEIVKSHSGGEKQMEFRLSKSGGAVIRISSEGKPLNLGLPLYIPPLLDALSVLNPGEKMKVIFLPEEVEKQARKEGAKAIADALLKRGFLMMAVELPPTLPLLCRLANASGIFGKEGHSDIYITTLGKGGRNGHLLH